MARRVACGAIGSDRCRVVCVVFVALLNNPKGIGFHMTIGLVVLACAPGVLLVLLLGRLTPDNHGVGALTLQLFLLGFVMTIPALFMNSAIERWTALWIGASSLWQQSLFWLLGIAWNEELCKFAALLGLTFFRRGLSTSQGVLCAASVAAGFASAENILYLQRFGSGVLWLRTVLTTPAHMGFTMASGFFLVCAMHANTQYKRLAWLMGGFLLAVGFHGNYDLLLSLPWQHAASLAYGQVAVVALCMLCLPKCLFLWQHQQPWLQRQ